MPNLLIELFSEEIPARMQRRAAEDLKKLITNGMVDAGLTYAGSAAFSTPRRLTLAVEDVLSESPTVREERKGPRVDAPEKAIEGFLRGAGLSKDQLEVRDEKKRTGVFRNHRKTRLSSRRYYCRSVRACHSQFPLAKVNALGGRGPAMGTSTAFDHLRAKR